VEESKNRLPEHVRHEELEEPEQVVQEESQLTHEGVGDEDLN